MTDRELLEELLNEVKIMKQDISSIKITLENDVSPKIDDLYSLYLGDSQRSLEKQVQENTDNFVINSVIRDIKMN
ncbi:MAG: hypothetical protein ACI4SF_16415 [Oscillospiraceae bacterium]